MNRRRITLAAALLLVATLAAAQSWQPRLVLFPITVVDTDLTTVARQLEQRMHVDIINGREATLVDPVLVEARLIQDSRAPRERLEVEVVQHVARVLSADLFATAELSQRDGRLTMSIAVRSVASPEPVTSAWSTAQTSSFSSRSRSTSRRCAL